MKAVGYKMKKKNSILTVLIFALFLLAMIIAVKDKINYFIDDMLSYALANSVNDFLFYLNPAERIERAEVHKTFLEYLSVSPGNRTNFDIVWTNQTNDVHPPLFYLLLHCTSSFKVGTFSKWYAAIINIFCMLGVLFVSRKIVKLFTNDNTINNLVSVGIATSYGLLSLTTLLRMYCLMMFFVTLITYIFLYYVENKITWKFYLSAYVVTVMGTLTHYYFIMYVVLLSVAFGIYLLVNRKFKETGLFVLTMVLAGLSAYLIFPAMIMHIFSSSVGSESLETAGGNASGNLFGNFVAFFNLLSDQMFGGLLLIIVVLIAILTVTYFKKFKIEDSKKTRYVIIYAVIVAFLFVESIVAVESDRYLSPIYAVAFTVIMTSLMLLIDKTIKNRKTSMIICTAFVICISALGLVNGSWPYQCKESKSLLDFENAHQEADLVVVNDGIDYELENNMFNMWDYNSITVLDLEDFYNSDLNEVVETDNAVFVLINIDDEEKILNSISERLTKCKNYSYIGKYVGAEYYYYE